MIPSHHQVVEDKCAATFLDVSISFSWTVLSSMEMSGDNRRCKSCSQQSPDMCVGEIQCARGEVCSQKKPFTLCGSCPETSSTTKRNLVFKKVWFYRCVTLNLTQMDSSLRDASPKKTAHLNLAAAQQACAIKKPRVQVASYCCTLNKNSDFLLLLPKTQ